MILQTQETLQFHHIKEEIAQFALSELGKEKIYSLEPSTNKKQIQAWLQEVSEGKEILKKSSSIPIHGLKGMGALMAQLNKGMALRPDQLMGLYDFLVCGRKLKKFMQDKEFLAPVVSAYACSMFDFTELEDEISRSIRNGRVDDYASKELLRIRKQIAIQEERLKEKIESVLKSSKYKKYIQEAIVSIRNGRYVIPVRKEYKKNIKGAILDTSASGSTVYIEPEEVQRVQDEIDMLKFAEEIEEQQILMALTGMVEANEREINISIETMAHYDFLLAKAKYSQKINGNIVEINDDHYIHLKGARHPLLGENAVPLDFTIGEDYHALVITGPNTGGKTVTIKTVGLLTLMAQCGLHVPAEKGSELGIFHKVLVDIGDGQSIEQNLSTFSSRILNIIGILKEATPHSLVLIDELGAGTDPGEGMGLAAAILEELYNMGATILATTHYSEIKDFANAKEGFQNGSMEFNAETLKPTYRLVIGQGGDSQAFAIALKLGMHPKIIEKAHAITYKETKEYKLGSVGQEEKRELEKQLAVTDNYVRRKKKNVLSQANEQMGQPGYEVGDNVYIAHLDEYGIIYKVPDAKGDAIVQVKGEKVKINHKRFKLYISRSELYPADYDFSIIFESKETRKKLHQMEKKHVEGLVIEWEEERL